MEEPIVEVNEVENPDLLKWKTPTIREIALEETKLGGDTGGDGASCS